MSDSTLTNWYDGMTASDRKGAEAKFKEANRQDDKKGTAELQAAFALGIAFRRYFRRERDRFRMAAAALANVGDSTAYVYVQADTAFRVFAADITAAGLKPMAIGVRAWSMLDRFTGSDEKEAKGRTVIAAEAKAAKKDGRSPFSPKGLQATINSLKPEGEKTGTDDERKVGRIAGKYRDDVRTVIGKAEAAAQEHGFRAAAFALLRQGALWSNGSGALTGTALSTLEIEWAAMDKAAAKEAAAIERKAEAILAEREAAAAAAASLKPEPQPKPEATITPQRQPKPKRTGNRKPRNTGTAELVKNAAPEK